LRVNGEKQRLCVREVGGQEARLGTSRTAFCLPVAMSSGLDQSQPMILPAAKLAGQAFECKQRSDVK